MSRVYRSAQGNLVDMEKLRLANEDTIAVGNMKVNARGDQLGPGGRIVKTRNQVMKEYYQLNTPSNAKVAKPAHKTRERPQQPTYVETPTDTPMVEASNNVDSDMSLQEEILQFSDGKKSKKGSTND